MNRQEALELLRLSPTAGTHEIRTVLFQYYEQLLEGSSEDGWEDRLGQLTEIRDTLMNPGSATISPSEHVLTGAADMLDPAQLPDHVHVLLYHQGLQETIHTLRFEARDLVLAFENEFTARKYTQQLAQNQCFQPWAERFGTQEILEFCEAAGYGFLLVPTSEMVQPPQQTVDELKTL
ncbi:DUF3110 domain-containing protein [Anthocerotibacter panamensis]|uniref:DUF3110 domain-containing protein n=1 Tax=Anthocerotibacter panamensis TaxID=2857077 RepID=UPI001C4054A2|nr:DUF3110 domain-containing protein [Anthocerotibacter panamensis]